MPQFRCRVGTPEGSIAERFVSAGSGVAAREQLVADGLEVFDVVQRSSAKTSSVLSRIASIRIGGGSDSETSGGLFRRRSRLASSDLLLLNQELAALVNAGLPLLRCVDILRTRRSGSLAGSMLDRVHRRLASGEGLSEAYKPEIERVGLPSCSSPRTRSPRAASRSSFPGPT